MIETLEDRTLYSTTVINTAAQWAALSSQSLAGQTIQLNIDVNRTLRLGADDNGVTIDLNGHTINAGRSKGIVATNTDQLTIKNGTIKGAGISRNAGNGIEVYASTAITGLTIDNVNVSGFRDNGIYVWEWNGSIDGVSITNSSATANSDGISTYSNNQGISNVYIGYCVTNDNAGRNISNPNGAGIELGGVNGAVIEYCTANNNGANTSGLGIWTYDSNNVVMQYDTASGNHTIADDGGGFDLDGNVTNSTILYCTSTGNAGAGYMLCQYPGATVSNNNAIIGCTSTDDSCGVLIWAPDGTAMSNITVQDCTLNEYKSVVSYGNVTGLTLSNNTYTNGFGGWWTGVWTTSLDSFNQLLA